MTKSEIIRKFLIREYPDNHLLIYLYCCGNIRTPNIVLKAAESLTSEIFQPMIQESVIKITIKEFFEDKKRKYKNGLITLKACY